MPSPASMLARAKRAEKAARVRARQAEQKAKQAALKLASARLRADRAVRAARLAAERKRGAHVWPGPGASVLQLQHGTDGLWRVWVQIRPGAMLWPIEHIAVPDMKRALVMARLAMKPTKRSR